MLKIDLQTHFELKVDRKIDSAKNMIKSGNSLSMDFLREFSEFSNELLILIECSRDIINAPKITFLCVQVKEISSKN